MSCSFCARCERFLELNRDYHSAIFGVLNGEEVWCPVCGDCYSTIERERYELVFREVARRLLLVRKGIEFETENSYTTNYDEEIRSRENALAVLAIVASAFPELRRRAYDFDARERTRRREELFARVAHSMVERGLTVAVRSDNQATSAIGAVTYALTDTARAFAEWVSHQPDRRVLVKDWITALERFEERDRGVPQDHGVSGDGRSNGWMPDGKGIEDV